MKLWLFYVIVAAVEHDCRQCKYNRQIRKQRNVGNKREGFEPADWYQDEHTKGNVCWLIVAEILPCFDANYLIHLMANKKEISDTEADLGYRDA